MPTKPEMKSPDELIHFIRILRRTGPSVLTLVLLVVGWTVVVVALKEVAKDDKASCWANVPFAAVYAYGTAGLLVLWLVFGPARLYWKPLVRLFCVTVVVFTLVLNIPLLPVTVPVGWLAARRRIRRTRKEWKERLKKQLEAWRKDPFKREEMKGKTAGEVQRAAKAGLKKEIREEAKEAMLPFFLPVTYYAISYALDPLLGLTTSSLAIGLVMGTIDSWGQEDSPAGLEASFRAGIDRFKTLFPTSTNVQRLSLVAVPTLFALTSDWPLQVLKSLSWLHFLFRARTNSADPDTVLLDLFPRPEADQDDRLFSPAVALRTPTLTVRWRSPWEVQTVLLLTHFAKAKAFRVLGLWRDEEEWQLVRVLAEEILTRLPDEPLPDQFYPSTHQAAVDVLSQYVGACLGQNPFFFLSKYFASEKTWEYLARVAARCAALEPRRKAHWYRLGAVECYLGKSAAAVDALRRAMELGGPQGHDQADKLWRSALYSLSNLDVGYERRLVWSVFVVQVAMAASTGDPEVCGKLYQLLNPSFSIDPQDPENVITMQIVAEGLGESTVPAAMDIRRVDSEDPSFRREYAALALARELMDGVLHQQIERRAHERWEFAGRPEGSGDRFWLEAEAEVFAQFPATVQVKMPLPH